MQVQELHRLYQVQKKLMAELRNSEPRLLPIPHQNSYATQMRVINPHQDPQTRPLRPPPMSTSFITIHHPYTLHPSFDIQCNRSPDEPSCSSQRGFDLERPPEEFISTTDQINANARTSYDDPRVPWRGDQRDVDTDLELTLSIGQQKMTSKKSKEKRPIGMHVAEEEGSHHPTSSSPDQESLQKPHWLLRALSLNRT